MVPCFVLVFLFLFIGGGLLYQIKKIILQMSHGDQNVRIFLYDIL